MNSVVINNPIDVVLKEAAEYMGVEETPKLSNRGIEIDYWLKETGVGVGNPWCAAFVSMIGRQALGVGWPVINHAYVQTIVNWGKKYSYDKPERGDLFALYFPSLNRYAHIGFVSEVLPNGKFKTIEGNSNNTGSRDGFKVAENTRQVLSNTKFIRWAEAIPSPHEYPGVAMR